MKGLKRIRKDRGFSQTRLGALLGVTHAEVGRWENGLRAMPSNKVAQAAVVLECHPGELFYPLPGAAHYTAAQREAAAIADKIRADGLETWLDMGRRLAKGVQPPTDKAQVPTILPIRQARAKNKPIHRKAHKPGERRIS